MQVMVSACETVPSVLGDPAPGVVLLGFGASSLDLEVRPWSTSADHLDMLHAVRIALYDALNEAGIEIPFDQIVIHKASESSDEMWSRGDGAATLSVGATGKVVDD